MLSIQFKNVGQGDSILLEWIDKGEEHYGIIDCNIYQEQNPLLEELKRRNIKIIDFVVLSHLHYDHYSGFAELLDYCLSKTIKINLFLHTFTNEYEHILNLTFMSKRVENNTIGFLNSLQNALRARLIIDFSEVSNNSKDVPLTDTIYLSFLAPNGRDSLDLSNQRANYQNGATSSTPDFNIMSTIIEITDKSNSVLLTSDAPKKSFNRIKTKIKSKVVLAQVPHHGSIYNLEPTFWKSINKASNCPAAFSVGDIKKDRLPNRDVVEFFETEGFYNQSTNFVHGLVEYYSPGSIPSPSPTTVSLLSTFSSKRPSTVNVPGFNRFSGDQLFQVL